MLLAINANNTNTKFAVFDGETIVGEWRQHTTAMRTGDEHAVWLFQLMAIENIDPKSITAAIIGSVVPQATFNLRRLCTRYFNCEPLVLGEPGINYGIEVKGAGAGADRICNTVGAGVMFPKQAMIVVDFGTATTFDVVDEQGAYCGGVIAPGINLSIEALVNATALLPRIVVERPAHVIGTNTVACMHSGVFWGYVGLIEGIVTRIKAEFGRPMRVISTGGLAPVFDGSTGGVIEQVIPDITMRGLFEIWRRNGGRL
jgi:type III pantothenate kinase